MRTTRGLGIVVLLCVAGMSVAVASATVVDDGSSASHSNGTAIEMAQSPTDPPEDRIGWEQGYWYNESIDVDQSDGLSATELQRYKARTMARLEHIRGLEFTDDVEIEFIGPDEVAGRLEGNVTQFRGSNQQWEALFVIGEDRNASRVIFETLVGNVGGWAAEEGSESVVLVTGDPEDPTASPRLLSHELVHVLQHQQFDLSDSRYQRSTMDGEHAKDALVEGEASYLDSVYRQYCSNGTWECVDGGEIVSGPGSGSVEVKLFPYLTAPYSLGSQYVAEVIQRGGLEAVNDAHWNPPRYSVTAFHADGEIEPNPSMTVPDRSSGDWTRAENPDRVGAMGLRAFATDAYREWRNGALYPYTNGSADGYVWETHWASVDSATGFSDAFRQRISDRNGSQVGDGVWVIPDGPFADAFSINRTGTTVRIVNAPTVEALSAVHAGSVSPVASTTTTGPSGSETTTGLQERTTAADDGPGFGIAVALVGLLIVAAGKRRSA